MPKLVWYLRELTIVKRASRRGYFEVEVGSLKQGVRTKEAAAVRRSGIE
jgi:hypothetical protein